MQMADQAEGSLSPTDSQNSTDSLLTHLAAHTSDDPRSIDEFKDYLMSSETVKSESEQECSPEPTDYDTQSHSFIVDEANEGCSASNTGTVGDFSGQSETSPADSGYHSLSNVCVPGSSGIGSHFPQRKPYPGEYDFHAFFEDCHVGPVSKNAPYTFSKQLRKLFVKMDVSCPIKFSLCRPPEGSVIRTMIIFAADEHAHHPVKICLYHSREKHSNEILKIVNHDNRYGLCYNGHHSVVTPYIHPHITDDPFLIQFNFGCRNSCPGGINRRPTYLVFLLEDCWGNVLGIDLILLKICSSPGRDRQKDINKNRRQNDGIGSNSLAAPATKRAFRGYKLLFVREENYEMLQKINDALNVSADVGITDEDSPESINTNQTDV